MGRELVRAWLVAWLVYAVPHLVVHAANIHHPLVIDRAGNLISLGFLVVPLILLYRHLSRESPPLKFRG